MRLHEHLIRNATLSRAKVEPSSHNRSKSLLGPLRQLSSNPYENGFGNYEKKESAFGAGFSRPRYIQAMLRCIQIMECPRCRAVKVWRCVNTTKGTMDPSASWRPRVPRPISGERTYSGKDNSMMRAKVGMVCAACRMIQPSLLGSWLYTQDSTSALCMMN